MIVPDETAGLSPSLNPATAASTTSSTTPMTAPADQPQRLAALNPLRSVCVSAPAGSGKTELLSQRVLTLLARVNKPEEILAITFTRKAAAEMHHRIIEALRSAKNSAQPQQAHELLRWRLARAALAQDSAQGWQLLSNPGRLKIQTIDSLCSMLTRQMPVLSNFGAQPQITERADAFYREAVLSLLQGLEAENSYAADLLTLLQHVDNDMQKLERLLVALLKRRDQWMLHIGLGRSSTEARETLESTLQALIENTLLQTRDELLPLAADLLPLLDYAGCNMQWQRSDSAITSLAGIVELPNCDTQAVEAWRGLADILLTKTGSWRKSVTKTVGFPVATHDGDKALAKTLKASMTALLQACAERELLRQSLVDLRKLPEANYPDGQWQLLHSLSRLLPVLVAQLRLVFQQRGAVDFIEVSMAASQALGDSLKPTDIAMKLDYQLKHILVDEFQDTSSTQFTLLQRLLEGWSEYNAINPQNPNTLFIVGDGMQSIYGFRQANVGLFLQAKQSGVNGVQLDDLRLTVNFRSHPAVVGWINDTFSQAFPRVEDLDRGAVPYEMSQAFFSSEQTSAVEIMGFVGDHSRVQEAQYLVELVQQSLAEKPAATIAVLIRSRNSLREIIPALSRAGIDWGARDINPLANYATVADLLILTKAMLNLADKISWAALLRTPFIGLNNSDMHVLLGAERQHFSVLSSLQDSSTLSRLSASGSVRVARASRILTTALQGRQRLGVRSWIEGVWMALGGAATVSDDEEFAFADDYFDLLEQFQQGEAALSIAEFEQAMLSLYAKPANDNATLQIMTIHKAKGLEFDVVILPGLARSSRSDDKTLLMWREYASGLIISPLGSAGVEDSVYQYLRSEQSLASRLEDTRLFYVAATRAISHLYLLFNSDIDNKTDTPRSPPTNSLLDRVWPAVEHEVQWRRETGDTNAQLGLNFNNGTELDRLKRTADSWAAPVMKFVNPLGDYYLDSQTRDDATNIPALVVDQLPRCAGLVTHTILEALAHRGDASSRTSIMSTERWQQWPASERELWLQALLRDEGLKPALWQQAVVQIVTDIDSMLADPSGQWILFGDHLHSFSEMNITCAAGIGVSQRIIDRCIIDREYCCWIVDYKTSRMQSGESQQQFIERETELYRGQLREYRRLVAAHSRFSQCRSIKTVLYFTSLARSVELQDEH